jgi:hypothetical protein
MDVKEVKGATSVGRLIPLAMSLLGLVACGGGSDALTAQPAVPTQPVAINVQSVLLTPSYTLDGGDFPISEYDDGNFMLRNTNEATDMALLGSSHDASPAAVRVIQGSYDVLFQHETGHGVPQNVSTPVQATGPLNANGPLAIALNSWTVSPTFQHNGGAFPVTEYDDGVFYLQPASGGEYIFLGNSHTAMPDAVQVQAGDYNVIYALETGGDLVPGNQQAVIDTLNVSADLSPVIDVTSGRFTLNATLDTAAFPSSQYQQAEFFLRNAATGDMVELGSSTDLPIDQIVVAGTYDIVYRHVRGDQLPVNSDAVIAAGVVIDADGRSVSLDIASVAITPAFTLDGGAFPASEYNDANFYLRSVSNPDDVMFIGASDVMPVAVRVIDSDFDTDVDGGGVLFGNYDVLYRHETGKGVPQNANALVQSNQILNMDGALAIAITSVDITGTFTLNGNSFPNDASDSVRFLLRDSSNDSDEFPFGFSDIVNEAVKIIPGTYHVVMDHRDGDAVPQNEMHEVDFDNVLDEDVTLNVNVEAVRVEPTFTLDDMAFPASYYQRATFYLRERHAPFSLIFLGESYKDNAPVMVIKENYDAIYAHGSGEQVPQNINNNVGLVDL